MKKEQMTVTAAIIKDGEKYLITQRPEGKHLAGKWEFPGGKVEFGENPPERLFIEIIQELNVKIKVGDLLGLSSHVYGGKRHVILLGYICKIISGKIKDKVNYIWVAPSEMDNYDFCEADTPFVKKLQEKEV